MIQKVNLIELKVIKAVSIRYARLSKENVSLSHNAFECIALFDYTSTATFLEHLRRWN